MPDDICIEHKIETESLVAMRRMVVKQRDDLQQAIKDLSSQIPEGLIRGPAFAIFWFVTDVSDGFDVEVGFPISKPFDNGGILSRTLPPLEVLSMMHKGPAEQLRGTLIQLYNYTNEHAIISDEFRREIYLDDNNPKGSLIELQFIIHNWNEHLTRNVERVLGIDRVDSITKGCEALRVDSSPTDRFLWTKGSLERLEALTTPFQRFDILSGCAHVFPRAQIEKLRRVFKEAIESGKTDLQAVDCVIDFMGQNPNCWGKLPRREGWIIYSTKNPRDQNGYDQASNSLERRKAYCFCPLLRNHMDQGMPLSFCNCGAGWYRQQWEGATGKPVRIEIIQSVSKGDDVCEFAIHLDDDLVPHSNS